MLVTNKQLLEAIKLELNQKEVEQIEQLTDIFGEPEVCNYQREASKVYVELLFSGCNSSVVYKCVSDISV